MRLAHFGTFDVANYGDLLFPLVVDHQLGGSGNEVVHLSPVGGQPYTDVPASVPIRDYLSDGDRVDAVVIGGGNILHGDTTGLPDYRDVRHAAYPSLWLGALALARRDDAPLVVNASGGPNAYHALDAAMLRHVSRRTSYFAVRDTYVRDRLSAVGVEGVAVVPDTALGISRVMPYVGDSRLASLGGYSRALRPREYLAVHVNSRYLDGDEERTVRSLDALAQGTGLELCLLPIGVCHGDVPLAERLAGKLRAEPILVESTDSVGVLAQAIAGSAGYIGSSLHGFITAASYAVPGALVVGGAERKFEGFARLTGVEDHIFGSWADASGAWADSVAGHPARTAGASEALARHWEAIQQAVSSPPTSTTTFPATAAIRTLALRNFAREKARRVAGRVRAARRGGAPQRGR